LRQGGDSDFYPQPNQWKTLVNRQNLREPINPQQNTPNIKFQTLAQFPSPIDILKIEHQIKAAFSQAAFFFA
jgi:hypothetical protein